MKRFKSIREAFPDVDLYWDYELNKISPDDVAHRSNKQFFWKCLKGHPSYLCTPDKRIYRNFGCPVCSNYKVIPGINDFKSTYPELMLDWNYEKNTDINPESISQRSITVVNWKCHKCGHEWTGRVRDATKKEINCPVCSRIVIGHKKHLTSLKQNGGITSENLLLDWDYSKNIGNPSDYSPQANKKAYWKCHVCGYEWEAKISNRKNGRGCPLCGNRVLVPGVNDLATKNPDLAKEWHPTKNGDLKPNMVFSSQNKKVWWLCPVGHEYQATINKRSGPNGTHCPICNSGRQTSFREQALYFYVRKMYPDAISRYKPDNFGRFELDIFIPSLRLAIEYDGVAWHKNENFDRERKKYHMCHELGIKLIRVKEKMPEELGLDLADTIISSDDFESEEGFTKALHIVLEDIDFSDIYWLKPIDINLSRDRFEIMKYATEIKNSFADEYPEKAKDWHPTKNGILKPTMFKPKSDFKAWWLCPDCGHEYERTINNQVNGGGCPKCVIKYERITRRMNLIKEKGSISNPVLLEDWNYEKNASGPDCYTNGSDEKVWWKCHICGHEWQERIANRHHGRGCPKCANRKLIVGHNDFATKHPELLNEWLYEKNIGISPDQIHYKSITPVWWKCPVCGYEYQAPPVRRSIGNGCRKCADKANGLRRRAATLIQNGSLGDVCPELISEYSLDNKLSPFEISSSFHDKVKWICSKCGYEWEAAPYTRKKGHGCKICGIKKSAGSRRKH